MVHFKLCNDKQEEILSSKNRENFKGYSSIDKAISAAYGTIEDNCLHNMTIQISPDGKKWYNLKHELV